MDRGGRALDESAKILTFPQRHLHRLRDIIERKSLLRGEFTLSSGGKSNYLFQLRQTTTDPEGLVLLGEVIVAYMKREGISCVGGMELGAVPLVTAIATVSYRKSYPVHAFFVRKKAKDHGARERIDGHILEGAEVLIVDDVTTTGASILATIEAIKEGDKRCTFKRALSVVDRQEGATEILAKHDIELRSLFKTSDFAI